MLVMPPPRNNGKEIPPRGVGAERDSAGVTQVRNQQCKHNAVEISEFQTEVASVEISKSAATLA
jgi:hypothetical protein